jgi:hypothetical protein
MFRKLFVLVTLMLSSLALAQLRPVDIQSCELARLGAAQVGLNLEPLEIGFLGYDTLLTIHKNMELLSGERFRTARVGVHVTLNYRGLVNFGELIVYANYLTRSYCIFLPSLAAGPQS